MLRVIGLLFCIIIWSDLRPQESIQAEKSLGVQNLVKNIFIKGNCRNVNNITAIGNEELSIGEFYNGEDNINVRDGIILSTGLIDLAQGPNIDNESGFPFDVQTTDPDLSQSATGTLYDVTGIEFDFVPLTDRISFRYVFASEEYCEFVGTEFNDVFGFFVSGPGINGDFSNDAINVASIITLDGSEEIVSINSINHLVNETFYVSNITTTDAQNCEIAYVPSVQELIEYDGFTIPLTASFSVIPCQTYRIRLIVGDVGDPILDSAVFLESNSFDLGEEVTVRAEVPDSDDPVAYESCLNGQFVFTRNDLFDINEELTVDIRISPDSDARNGEDFEEIPLTITIPAGDTTFILPIVVLEDNVIEGPESLKLEIRYDCDCIDPAFSELVITEYGEFSAEFTDVNVCANQTFELSPEILGGVPPYEYLWESGETSDTIELSIAEATQYQLRLTDFCGNSITTIADIRIQDIPEGTLMGTYDYCQTSITGIPVSLSGTASWSLSYSVNGVQQTPIDNIQSSDFFLNTPTAGNYQLTALSDAYCVGTVMGTALVESPFVIETELVDPSCAYSQDGSISITALEATAPYTIDWNVESIDPLLIENLQAGSYTLQIVDDNNCIYQESYELRALSDNIRDCVQIYIPNVFAPDLNGNNDFFSIVFSPDSGIRSVLSLQVFNRWGSLIFEQSNFPPVNGAVVWNGEYNGKALNSDVYVYKLTAELEDDSTIVLKGDITLIR